MKSVATWLCVFATACTPTSEPQRPGESTGKTASAPTPAPSATPSAAPIDDGWKKTAAAYLDRRSKQWLTSPPRSGQRLDCALSCHTTHPYLFSRSLLDTSPSDITGEMRTALEARVAWEGNWKKQTPWYGQDGSAKAAESLGSEAVLNAVTLVLHDRALNRTPLPSSVRAVERMWEVQRADGGFDWLDFSLEPWEAGNETWGAAMAALAAGHVGADRGGGAKPAVDRLRAFLRERPRPTLHDQLAMLWAATALDGLVADDARNATLASVLEKQRPDGGWSAEALMGVLPGNATANAYATAFATFVLCTVAGNGAAREVGTVAPDHTSISRGVTWLLEHQREDGAWVTPSSNRDSARGGRFMTDAATAYATLALTRCAQ